MHYDENQILKLFKLILNRIFSNQKESKKIKSQNHMYHIYIVIYILISNMREKYIKRYRIYQKSIFNYNFKPFFCENFHFGFVNELLVIKINYRPRRYIA